MCERVILATKNEIVHEISSTIQELIPGEEKIYVSINTMTDKDKNVNFPAEFLSSLNIPRMPLDCLKLKVGSLIILLRNMYSPKLCNSTRLCIKQLRNNIIEANIKKKDKRCLYPEYLQYQLDYLSILNDYHSRSSWLIV